MTTKHLRQIMEVNFYFRAFFVLRSPRWSSRARITSTLWSFLLGALPLRVFVTELFFMSASRAVLWKELRRSFKKTLLCVYFFSVANRFTAFFSFCCFLVLFQMYWGDTTSIAAWTLFIHLPFSALRTRMCLGRKRRRGICNIFGGVKEFAFVLFVGRRGRGWEGVPQADIVIRPDENEREHESTAQRDSD